MLTLAQIEALIADGGSNTAADVRAIFKAFFRERHAPHSLDHAEDVFWDGDDLAGFTDVDVTGSHTLTESGDGFLRAVFDSQDAADVNARLKARTFAVGDSFAIGPITFRGKGENHTMVGLCFTDGTDPTSNSVLAMIWAGDGVIRFAVWHGTLTNNATMVWADQHQQTFIGPGFVRLTYAASNSFQAFFSSDGVNWLDIGQVAFAKTMTPTHLGPFWTRWGGGAEASQVVFGALCKLA
jgi:hypothetical protein